MTIRANGARALRVRFEKLDVEGSVWLYGDERSGPQIGPYRNGGPHRDGSFWSEFVFSESVTVEYVPDRATAAERVPFRIRSVAQIVGAWFPAPRGQAKPRATIAGCHLDASCYPDLQKRDQPSVARLYITNADGTSSCTGFLINPRYRSDKHLLFLTAAHCISTQEEARNASFLWNYQTEACYGNPDWQQWAESLAYTYGASLVVSKQDRYDDFALLALSRAEVSAATRWWAEGWNIEALRMGDWVSAVGRPDGSHKRAAFGQVVEGGWKGLSSLGFGKVQWRRGTSEAGSSGSPVLKGTGENRRVVGIVSGSNSSSIDDGSPWGRYCDVALRASFSRFDRIYETVEPYLESERRLLARPGMLASQATADGHGDQLARATSPVLGSSVSGHIDWESDVDYFRLEVSQRTEVQIFTAGSLGAKVFLPCEALPFAEDACCRPDSVKVGYETSFTRYSTSRCCWRRSDQGFRIWSKRRGSAGRALRDGRAVEDDDRTEIVFEVREDQVDGGCSASALGYGIHTEAETVSMKR